MKRSAICAINSTPPPPSSLIRNSGWSTKWGHRKFLEIRSSEIQRERQSQQAWPQLHVGRNAPPRGVERVGGRHAEAAAGGRRDLAQQRLVVAVLLDLVFLTVETHLGEGARIHQGTHPEESLVLPDPQAPAIVAGRHLAHLQRRMEPVR